MLDIHAWYLYYAILTPTVGSEINKKRPVLVISEEEINQILPVVNVLPLTTRKKGRRVYPNEVLISAGTGGLTNDSIVLCYQIRTLDKSRFIKEIGNIEALELQEEIISALCFQLGIIK